MGQSIKQLAVVTGASTGIGYELAIQCAKHGFDLVVAADEPEINAAADAFRREGVSVDAIEANLATTEGCDRLYAALKGRSVDALLANAGRGLGRGFLDQDWEDIRYVIDTNVTGTVYLIQKIAREMRARNYQTSQRFNRTLSRPLRSHPMAGKIIAVSCDSAHRFSKPN